MMSSGMNGQSFAFNGYLPIDKTDRKKTIKELEKLSKDKNQSQIFIETPYRNEKLLADLKATLTPTTNLCVAADKKWNLKFPLLLYSKVGAGIFIKLIVENRVFKNLEFVFIFVKSTSKLK